MFDFPIPELIVCAYQGRACVAIFKQAMQLRSCRSIASLRAHKKSSAWVVISKEQICTNPKSHKVDAKAAVTLNPLHELFLLHQITLRLLQFYVVLKCMSCNHRQYLAAILRCNIPECVLKEPSDLCATSMVREMAKRAEEE